MFSHPGESGPESPQVDCTFPLGQQHSRLSLEEICLVLKRKSGGRRERRRRGAGRRAWGGRSRPESEAPRGRTPRGCEPRNARSDRRAGRGAVHLSAGGGAAAGTTRPPRAPRPSAPSRPFPPALRRRSAPLPPLAPLLPASEPGCAASSGRRVGRGSFRAAASAHLGGRSQSRVSSPKPLPGKGLPRPPPSPSLRNPAGLLVSPRPASSSAGGSAPRPGMGVSVAGTPGRQWPERGAGDATGGRVAGSGPGPLTAVGADPAGDGAGAGGGDSPFLLPSRGGDRPGPRCRCVGEAPQVGDSAATGRRARVGALRVWGSSGAAAGQTLGRVRT